MELEDMLLTGLVGLCVVFLLGGTFWLGLYAGKEQEKIALKKALETQIESIYKEGEDQGLSDCLAFKGVLRDPLRNAQSGT